MQYTCHSCGREFEVKASTNRKKYCYKCLPLGHSAAKFMQNSDGKEFKCKQCKKKFIYRRNTYNNSTSICGVCLQKNHKIDIKNKAIELLGGNCIRCGYDTCVDVLTFHHKNPKKKKFNISRIYNYSWKKVKPEVQKCVLVCMNCHIELHAGIWKL